MSRVCMVSEDEREAIKAALDSGELDRLPLTLKTEEAVIISRRADSTIRRACSNGIIKASRAGGTWCINRDSLLAYAGLR